MTSESRVIPRIFSAFGVRQVLVAIVAFVATVALAATFFTVPSAEAQTGTQPDYPANSRQWDPAIPFAPGSDVAANPADPEKCGQDIALVFDLSTSIGEDGLAKSKEAGKAIVNALDSTPTRIGIYNFGTVAPAKGNENATIGIQEPGSAATLNGVIDQMNLPASGYVGTNWDRGIGQIPTDTYDVVYFITDGLPTAFEDARGNRDAERGLYNRPYYNHAHNGKANKDFAAAQADVQRAVASANKLKRFGTRIVPLAVGDEVNQGTIAPTYLNYISGQGDSIPVSNYGELAEKLVEQATKACRGEVTIEKSLVAKGSSSKLGEGGSVDGWKFSITDTEAEGNAKITPLEDEVATAQGKATLRYVTSGPNTKGTVTIEEKDGKIEDVQCTDEKGAPIEVDREGNTFKVPAKTGGKVTCEVKNLDESTPDLSSGSSSVPERCIPAVGGLLGVMLLALPIALLSHVKIPTLEGLRAHFSDHIQQTNNKLQRGLGIHDEHTSAWAAQVNNQLKALGANAHDAAGAFAGIAALFAVGGYLAAFCLPGTGSSGEQVELSELSSGSSRESE
nr:Uncharacterised protein [Streptococcus thermophilus]